MKVTPEMMAKFEQCQSAEEVMELAKQENISITMEQARKAFELLSSEELSDEMLEIVSGGEPGGGTCHKNCNSWYR